MYAKCTLTETAKAEAKCSPWKCYCCGWNADEMARRNRQIKAEGLTLCEDGLERLIIHGAKPFQ